MGSINRKLSVAPMMDWTDRHDRFFLRLLSPNALLYSEMVTTGAVIHGDRDKLLGFNEEEHPVAVQLGGSDPGELAESAKICEAEGYDEINLNVGCPSDRVQRGKIGACLMAEPNLVAECVAAMQQAVALPVTVKCRTGIDDLDDYKHLHGFIARVASTGCKTFIIHARKAWLSGLSPKQNREIPPLEYHKVYQIKQDFPDLEVILNGGITNVEGADEHLKYVDGVMIGREAYQNPYFLVELEQRLFSCSDLLSREQAVEKMVPYINKHLAAGGKLSHITRHMLGLYHKQPRGRLWRRHLSENAHHSDASPEIMLEALDLVRGEVN